MFAFYDNGLSWRGWKEPLPLNEGEIVFDVMPSPAELEKKFPGYKAAAVARQAETAKAARLKTLQSSHKTGLVVMSSIPSVRGTYGTAHQDEINIASLRLMVANGTFPGYYRDIAGVKHEMGTTKFVQLADAIQRYIAACDNAHETGAHFPSATVTL